MILKVKHEELKNVTDLMKKDAEALSEEINNVLSQIEFLKSVWEGSDSTIFYNNAYNYFNKMTTIAVAIQNLSKFIDKANNNYEERDESFSRELDTEVDNYEQDSNNGLQSI